MDPAATQPPSRPADPASLPGLEAGTRVRIVEVGARDGLQIEREILPPASKIALIRGLADAGLRCIEATSFVSPRWVPQLADAEEVLRAVADLGERGVELPVLVPNERGLERALAAGARSIEVFTSATESFAMRNWNRDLAGVLAMAAPVAAAARADGLPVRGYLSMCWGDPWEGPTEPARVAGIAAELLAMGCDSVSLGDTIGVATAGGVHRLLGAVTDAGIGLEQVGLHFHDTYGQAVSNVQAGLLAGVRTFDSSAGGMGGCPYAESATGNLATEDLVWFLEGVGIDTGVDLPALARVSAEMAGQLGRPAPSAVARALAPHGSTVR
ncbi:hydroxymethylglutaryl-CoA lyase [Naumannella cuiyingiana]|uniref:Hydroxymethylglutaryl-CoA lyase n=1 Tax=Naumannella cuiyingiana TaxID=1347891 RepID=A0A7Z0DBW2_9ACTN|nr:hydroxymethylglutaryl-CoA lyase [Naumannella cuiyingiana]NYI72522.1 hydroxymethylglutaryl-CoA lyase [Naumannella cuiyingiana]